MRAILSIIRIARAAHQWKLSQFHSLAITSSQHGCSCRAHLCWKSTLKILMPRYASSYLLEKEPPVGPKAFTPSGQLEQVQAQELKTWRRKCGCIRTSEKLKNILDTFPSVPPPTPTATHPYSYGKSTCAYCAYSSMDKGYTQSMEKYDSRQRRCFLAVNSRSWQVVAELVQLVQLSVTATALALYYLIYCYMQLVYYTLRSALYFHNADGPMKITIGVVTVTSLIVGFNLMLRMERILGILY